MPDLGDSDEVFPETPPAADATEEPRAEAGEPESPGEDEAPKE